MDASFTSAPWPMDKVSVTALEEVARGNKTPAVLVTTGGMNPVHKGHIGILHQAAARLREQGFAVVAAFLSPSHDGYLQPKAKSQGTIGLSAHFRVALARKMLASDPYVQVGSWEAFFPGSWPDFPEVCQALRDEILRGDLLPKETKVFYVCGTDLAARCGLTVRKVADGVVIVPRAGDIAPMERPQKNVFVAFHTNADLEQLSSTKIRASLAKEPPDESYLRKALSDDAVEWLLRPQPEHAIHFQRDMELLGMGGRRGK